MPELPKTLKPKWKAARIRIHHHSDENNNINRINKMGGHLYPQIALPRRYSAQAYFLMGHANYCF